MWCEHVAHLDFNRTIICRAVETVQYKKKALVVNEQAVDGMPAHGSRKLELVLELVEFPGQTKPFPPYLVIFMKLINIWTDI